MTIVEVAGKKLAAIALETTEETSVCSEASGTHIGDRRSLERDRIERMRAIRYVMETGLVYRPLVDKWRFK